MADQLKALLNELSDDIGEARGRCSGDYLGPLVRKIIDLVDRSEQVGVPTVQAGDEPVLYQRRMRPKWRKEGMGWTGWEDCSKETVEDLKRLPETAEDWQYETRALCIAAPSQPVAGKDPQHLAMVLKNEKAVFAQFKADTLALHKKSYDALRNWEIKEQRYAAQESLLDAISALGTTANAGKEKS